jgi:hypothetical protein
MTTPIAPYNWHIAPEKEAARSNVLTTTIYPVRPDVALVVTNSFGGVPLAQWLVLERFVNMIDNRVYTVFSFVAQADRQSEALNYARSFGCGVYGVDITINDAPF